MNTGGLAKRRVAVVGGGITGLSAALRLAECPAPIAVTLWEADDRTGGVLRTTSREGYLLEHGPDNFLSGPDSPWGQDLAVHMGLEQQLIGTAQENQRALVVRDGVLHPIPGGFYLMGATQWWPVLRSPLLTIPGRLRLMCEPFVRPRRDGCEETLEQFATRRVGREAFQWLVEPLVAGIYSSDPQKLSVAAALPQFVHLEQKYGSIARGLQRRVEPATAPQDRERSGARYRLFLTLRSGMRTLCDAIEARLPDNTIRVSRRVQQIRRLPNGPWQIGMENGTWHDYDAVILALPAPAAANVVDNMDDQLANQLRDIRYTSIAIVAIGAQRSQFTHPLDAFGLVIPSAEGLPLVAISFSSQKFPGRAPQDDVLLRAFVGGAGREHLVELTDEELQQLTLNQLRPLLGFTGSPQFATVIRWRQRTPQYELGHQQRVQKIRDTLSHHPGLELAGNAYSGVGIPQCIHSGQMAADRIIAVLAK